MFTSRSVWLKVRLPLLLAAVLAFKVLQLPAAVNEPEPAVPGSAAAPQKQPDGFDLQFKRGFVGVHAGYDIPRAKSDLFSMVTSKLTLEKSDFRSSSIGFDFGVFFQSHFATVFSIEYSKATPNSEYRNFVHEDGTPVTQSTKLIQVPVTASLRVYPMKFGETVGSYAWVPARFLPYVAGGGGFVRYKFTQNGDFVDSQSLEIFPADLESKGYAFTKHLAAGIDIGVTSRVFANAEFRYSWANADLSDSFGGFQPIDLTGARLNGGIFFRF